MFVAHFLGWAQNSQGLIFCALFFFWSHLAKNIFLDKFWFSKKVMVLKFFLGGFDFSGSIDQDWERGVGRNFTNIFFVQITDNISKKKEYFVPRQYIRKLSQQT